MASTQQSNKNWSSASSYLSSVDMASLRCSSTRGSKGGSSGMLLDSAHKKIKLKRYVGSIAHAYLIYSSPCIVVTSAISMVFVDSRTLCQCRGGLAQQLRSLLQYTHSSYAFWKHDRTKRQQVLCAMCRSCYVSRACNQYILFPPSS